jgi:hypothetical protein
MKRILFICIVAVLLFFALSTPKNESAPTVLSEEAAVKTVVASFGERLKNVPLAGSSELVRAAIQKEYVPYVAPALLERWLEDPARAPGRETSSPWPERIDIKSIQKVGDYYEIEGEIVYMTSAEVTNGGDAGRAPVFLTAAFLENQWRIAEYQTSLE